MKKKKIVLQNLSGEVTGRTPVWLMRQAGRYLPEYRKVRSRFNSFIDFCLHPEAVLEVSLQPLNRFDLDAVIIFSDILMVPYALGLEVNFVENVGPVVQKADSNSVIDGLVYQPEQVMNISQAIKAVCSELDNNFKQKTLIGFAGSPWTVAAYMVEGTLSKTMETVRGFAQKEEELFRNLIKKIELATIEFLKLQINAGVEVIKLFDSWAGVLTPSEFKKWSLEPNKRIVDEIKRSFPHIKVIGFPRNVGFNVFDYVSEVGVDCLAVDQFSDLANIRGKVKNVALQGNLDNILLAYSRKEIKNSVTEIVKTMKGYPFIFNLGHGVLPITPIENIELLVNVIRELEE